MPGFNYGGKGDGTGWSSERGDGPAPNGGNTSSGNGGSSSSSGEKGGKTGSYGPPVSKALGDALATSLGIDPSSITGYYTDVDGNVIGISTLVGGDIFGVDLGPAPAGTPPKSGHDPYKSVSKNNSYWGDIKYKGDTSNARIAELNKIIQDNALYANMNQSGQRITTARRKTKLAQGELGLINDARKTETEALTKASELISDIGEKVSNYAGEKYKAVSDEIASNIRNFQGKTIRNYDDAMKSLNKVLNNPNLKINAGDRTALANALAHMDASDMADKLGKLAKGFKVADALQKIEKIREKSITGIETGNWGPLVLEVESWVVGGLVSSLAVSLFTAVLSIVGVAAVAPTVTALLGVFVAVLVASLIDDKLVDKINNVIVKPLY